MAEAIARDRIGALEWDHVEVASAGTSSFLPSPPSEGAARAAGRHGLDLSQHRSQALTDELVRGVDLVLTMTPAHLERVVELGAGDRAALLAAFAQGGDAAEGYPPVPDPFGGSDDTYEETFLLLQTLVERSLLRLAPSVNT